MSDGSFTPEEVEYLRSQRLGRLATVAPDGTLQNNPVGFVVNELLGTIDVYGRAMGATRKFRNLRTNPQVAFVVDDVASLDPWEVRGVEVRGVAEALDEAEPPMAGMSRQLIRIRPRRIVSWNVDHHRPGMLGRDVALPDRVG